MYMLLIINGVQTNSPAVPTTWHRATKIREPAAHFCEPCWPLSSKVPGKPMEFDFHAMFDDLMDTKNEGKSPF